MVASRRSPARRPGASSIPAGRVRRNPLISPRAYDRLTAILQHPDAPRWNYEVGDRVETRDLAAVEAMRHDVRDGRTRGTGRPPARILDWVERQRSRVAAFGAHLAGCTDLARDWDELPTLSRQDLAVRPEYLVPVDIDLSRLIVYDTSGVTGHAIRVPHHPAAVAVNHALMEFVLAQHRVHPAFSEEMTACLNVGAQVDTVVFATVFGVWQNAAFAKVNLHGRVWEPARARRFFRDMSPAFLTGDPLGFAEMLAWEIEHRPAAMLSTAVALLPGLADRLARQYGCPVIDTYATTETGPIAYASTEGDGLSVLPPDIYVEIVDAAGRSLPEGEVGEICVTGGRNPFLPLLRYRTGDFGCLRWSDPPASDPVPRIVGLRARQAVAFRASDGTVVSPVDIGRIVREWIVVQHAFVQRRDGSCELAILPAPACPIDVERIRDRLIELFGHPTRIDVRIDPMLGADQPGGKVVPFRLEE